MNIYEAIKAIIDVNGYDGLANPEIECGCGGDYLMVCEEPDLFKCELAIKYKNLYYPAKNNKKNKLIKEIEKILKKEKQKLEKSQRENMPGDIDYFENSSRLSELDFLQKKIMKKLMEANYE